jgi:DNA replication protein DnaC
VPFTPEGARLLFQAFSERYLKGSLLITSNLEFSRWLEVFGNERLTGALLDRLTHHCHVLEFNGDSYRFKESLREQAAQVFSLFALANLYLVRRELLSTRA